MNDNCDSKDEKLDRLDESTRETAHLADSDKDTKQFDIKFSGTRKGFRRALSVYVNKPHVVNRRLCGAKTLHVKWYSSLNSEHFKRLLDRLCVADEIDEITDDDREITPDDDQADLDVDLDSYDEGIVVIVRDLIPKQIDKYPTLREVVSFDTSNERISFHPVCHVQASPPHRKDIDEDVYHFKYKELGSEKSAKLEIYIESKSSKSDKGHVTTRWLTDVLLPKLARWGEENELRTATSSLRLVPVDEYNKLYNNLKVKYGYHFVETWPERTDPKKFVYEDVAIATYLLLIWKADRERKKTDRLQSFVDLGCGNGLLVHILSAEGHPGVGLDIRRRKIWEIYGQETVLKEQSVIPSAESLFPEYDWLIGNHSDELTPWIPLMAARSSYSCCYFVLPCCLYDFDRKFSVREKGRSPYRTYLDFVQEVGEVCGFRVEEDVLRIPSTKRVCFIGRERRYPETDAKRQDEKRSLFVAGRCSQGGANSDKQMSQKRKLDDQAVQWSSSFEPRSSKELVRNCQKVAKETKELIVQRVFNAILSAEDCETVSLASGKTWRKGGCLLLSDVAKMFDETVLQQLKAENGGLQTLLRNHNSIFQVSGGAVRLRDLTQTNPWSQSKKAKARKVNSKDYHKTSLCWFNIHHPDGCPRTAENCKYAHGEQELQEKPKFDT